VSRKELAELNARLGPGGAREFSAPPLGVVGRSGSIGTIQQASPAELAGLRPGDVIVSIDVPTPPGPPGRGSRTFIITVRRADRLLTLRAIQPPSSTR
jgi:membrane-associated protease RseP (regulator of RpoE activity)